MSEQQSENKIPETQKVPTVVEEKSVQQNNKKSKMVTPATTSLIMQHVITDSKTVSILSAYADACGFEPGKYAIQGTFVIVENR